MGDETRKLPAMTPRERNVWDRLAGFYGSLLGDRYGPVMPMAWREELARLNEDQVTRALAVTRVDFVQWPPTLGQFVQASRPPAKVNRDERSVAERLCTFAARTLHPRVVAGSMPPWQFSGPWTYVYRETREFDEAGRERRGAVCVGVIIPAVGEGPRIYISAADMDLAEAA